MNGDHNHGFCFHQNWFLWIVLMTFVHEKIFTCQTFTSSTNYKHFVQFKVLFFKILRPLQVTRFVFDPRAAAMDISRPLQITATLLNQEILSYEYLTSSATYNYFIRKIAWAIEENLKFYWQVLEKEFFVFNAI